MKRIIIVFALIVAAVALTAVVFAFGAIRNRGQQKITWPTQSPNGTYVVNFSGMPSSRSWPFTGSHDLQNRKVTIAVSKYGRAFVDSAEVYDGDAYDSSFRQLYSEIEWTSENTLHLWHKRASREVAQGSNEISIVNNSNEAIRYLFVKAGKTNLFLLFDLPKDARLSLHTQLEHWEDLVGCEGKFENRDFAYRSANFSLAASGNAPTRYKLTIQKDGCSVTGEQ